MRFPQILGIAAIGREIENPFGMDVNDIWAVGRSGTVLKWNGATWTAQQLRFSDGFVPDLSGVWGSSADDLWAAGTGGAFLCGGRDFR